MEEINQLVDIIVEDTIMNIKKESILLSSDSKKEMPYYEQHILEEVIKKLNEKV